MKAFLLVCYTVCSSAGLALAGSESYSKESKSVPPPCPSWYADGEWNLNLAAVYAFTDSEYPTLENSFGEGALVPIGPAGPNFEHDRYLNADHAWGGSLDIKYFFCRYFGVGVQGFGLDVRQSYADVFIDFGNVFGGTNYARTSHSRELIGGGLATLTLRYPIGCSRFAPYVFVGGGAIFGGGQLSTFHNNVIGDVTFTTRSDSETKAIGQFGGGLEVRITPRIGWTNDFTWNVVDGRNNNFGMARTGINFAF
jgi:hypothetical protein